MTRGELTSLISETIRNEIIKNGAIMLGCAIGSVIGAVVVNFFVTRLSGRLGKRIRSAIYDKVMNFSDAEIKHFSTPSLITRTTNDVTQVQNLFSMGVRVLVRAPVMVIISLSKIASSNKAWTLATIIAVVSLVSIILTIVLLSMPKFKKLATGFACAFINLIKKNKYNSC